MLRIALLLLLFPATNCAAQNLSTFLMQQYIKEYKAAHKGVSAADLRCLSEALYFEARGESPIGQIAVAQVILLRKASNVYPNTVCGVVYNDGQFTYNKSAVVEDKEAWYNVSVVAESVLLGKHTSVVQQSLHYHALHVTPYWADPSKLVCTIGNHAFYEGI